MTDAWHGRACLVTGGAGFGGSHLVQELVDRGARVTVIDRDPIAGKPLEDMGVEDEITFVHGDLRDGPLVRSVFSEKPFDVVFHLAADPIVINSIREPAAVVDTNVRSTTTLLEACRLADTAPLFVFASSGAYYGDHFSPEPIPESHEPGPAANLYGPSKAAAEMIVRGYGRAFRMPVTACRFMNTYGPGDRHESRLVPRALAQLAGGTEYDFGDRDDGSTRLDFLYVGDMARAYMSAAEHLATGGSEIAFNFGTGTLTSVKDVAERVSLAYDGEPREPLFRGVRTGPVRQKRLDVAHAAAVLGWNATTSLDDGLAATAAWHRAAVPAA
ncbi:NAD-dependent epimerase/dehydratase family protein [Demequina mangrovi]|uniref:CDP-glucose 4,6-dehydratase/UDP-glucose 4-epimerase n=1 Tax=Demequina mangrovi TaxID=1043493 RepID=A0A1H7B131_9MICO|nr:NAD-dependent epimerase/dehydratase family protein [Demequina mangrovi]SEJ67055.1 CDP-glucose 4,6-dehydratase/UDP-glucose 4-epimerase [Demequina mangrovi]